MPPLKENRLYRSLVLPIQLVLLIWAIHLVQSLTTFKLGLWGAVYPRETDGLLGIFTSPLLHADLGHIMANTPPLFVLCVILMFFYRSVAVPAFLMIYFLTGVAVWALARSGPHVGASGVIYGLVAFVFWTGIFRRNLKSIVLALLVLFYYGSLFLGIVPATGKESVSWESHLLGGLVGIFVAFLYKDRVEKDEVKEKSSWELEPPEEERAFLDPKTFEQTRSSRERDRNEGNHSGRWYQSNT